MNESWKEISLEFYLEYLKMHRKYKDDVNYKYIRLAFLENKSVDEMISTPFGMLSIYHQRWEFITEDILSTKEDPMIDIEGKIYYIQKEFDLMNLEQYENIDSILKMHQEDKNFLDDIHLLLAIAIQKRKEYSYEEAKRLSQLILKEKLFYISPAISFFLSDGKKSNQSILTYLEEKKREEIMKSEAMLIKLQNSIDNGDGIPSLKRWQITIYVSMMLFYLKLYKKFLLN